MVGWWLPACGNLLMRWGTGWDVPLRDLVFTESVSTGVLKSDLALLSTDLGNSEK